MTETFFTARGWIVGGSPSEYLRDIMTRISTAPEVRTAFAKASPAERTQIIAFTKANTEPPRGRQYWRMFLIRVTNLDTGRKFLTAGISEESDDSLSVNQFRSLLDLAPVSPIPIRKVIPKPIRKG